jgi:hypothetical protein
MRCEENVIQLKQKWFRVQKLLELTYDALYVKGGEI